MLGASGSGKSNALLWTVQRHIDDGFGVVVLDMKGDRSLAQALRAKAAQYGQPFHFWSLEGGDRWNPLLRGNRSELKDKLIATDEFSERHYEAMYERYLVNLFRVLEDRERERHLRNVVRLLDPNELAMEARNLANERAAEEIGRYLAGLTADQVKHLSGLRDRLALLIEGGQGEWLMPFDEPDGEIDLANALHTDSVVIFSLNSSSYGATAKLIGNMVIHASVLPRLRRQARPSPLQPGAGGGATPGQSPASQADGTGDRRADAGWLATP
jgi:conjugal transfer pilus assembly protein TraD